MTIYSNTYLDGLKKCISCKHRFRKITGGCDIIAYASGAGIVGTARWFDDMYGCDQYEPLNIKHNDKKE